MSSPKSSCWSSKRNRMSARLGLRWHVMIRNSQWKQIVYWQTSRWISWTWLLPGRCFLHGTEKSREIMAIRSLLFIIRCFSQERGKEMRLGYDKYWTGYGIHLVICKADERLCHKSREWQGWSLRTSCWCIRRCLIFWPYFLMHMIIVSKIRKGA